MRKAIAAIFSLTILGIIYWHIDIGAMANAFVKVDWGWFFLALLMVAPLTAMSAWRLSFLAPKEAKLTFFQSLNLTLMASVLNAVLPSKLGDLARSYALTEQGHMPPANALALVVFEKAWDVLALLFWCAFGLVIIAGPSIFYWVVASAIILVALIGGMMVSSLRLLRKSVRKARLGFPGNSACDL